MKGSARLLFVSALALMAATAALLLWLRGHQRLGPPGLKMELPVQVLDYDSDPVKISDEELQTLPKDTTFSRRLYKAVQADQTNYLQLSIVLMGTDRTSIHKPQFCLVGQGWQIDASEAVSVPIPRPHPYLLPAMKLTASKTFAAGNGATVLKRALYVYWFVADQELTASHWERMWAMARTLLRTGTLQRWAYVSCFTYCDPGQEAATYQQVQDFLAAAVPTFQLATRPPRS